MSATISVTTKGGPHESDHRPVYVNPGRRHQLPHGAEHQRSEFPETYKAPAGRVADESPATHQVNTAHKNSVEA